MSESDTDVAFENPKLAAAFTSYLHQLLPLLDAGGEFADYYRFADMEAIDRFVVRLHKPLPPDLLGALLVLTGRTRGVLAREPSEGPPT